MNIQSDSPSLARLVYQIVLLLSTKTWEDKMNNIEIYKGNIPKELRKYKQWLWYKIYKNTDKYGNEKTTKIPISPITLSSKDWNNKDNWASFDNALERLKCSGCDGLSFVMSSDDPFVCIDLDRVDDKKKTRFLSNYSNTYKEISLSGKGIHIFVKGDIPKNFNNQIEKVEMYKENRCIAMTGNIIDLNANTVSSIKDSQDNLTRDYEEFAPIESIRKLIEYHRKMDYAEINSTKAMEAMLKHNSKARGLFDGSYSTGDSSKDDFNLLLFLNSFTHGNHQMIKEIFLDSSLNREGDKSKRRNEKSYHRYLDESIEKAIKIGRGRYWDYNYHKKIGGRGLE